MVGVVEEPSYLILLEAPPPTHVTAAGIGEPVYACGELVTKANALAGWITNSPAERLLPAL